MARLRYPIGIQTFSEIRENGYVYVDKTDYAFNLISGGKYYFLSRPRRFGKSLFLSMVHSLMAGERQLFEGLAISRRDWDWTPSPVLHLDFTGTDYDSPESLAGSLNSMFEPWEELYGCTKTDRPLDERFRNIIRAAHEQTRRKVVILIDEYDKPLLENIRNQERQEKFRNMLRGVYGNLKRMDAHIRFAMLTGVTKFGHLSIFSDLNNLSDISLDRRYAGICGITSEELREYFSEGIDEYAEKWNMSQEAVYEELRLNYDGYHFSPEGGPDIYNPFSLLSALEKCVISDYWFKTGTPTFLVEMIKSKRWQIVRLENTKVSRGAIENVSFDMKDSLLPVLYQTGYLTIKSYNKVSRILNLDFPNMEVERGFLESLMKIYIPENTCCLLSPTAGS